MAAEPLEPKIWQLEPPKTGREGYLYYCALCDEALALSRHQIHLQKIRLVFNETCPGCGFELEKVLRCQASKVPTGTSLFTNPKCPKGNYLIEADGQFESKVSRGSAIPRDPRPDITTGIESLDKTLVLKFGQLAALQGETSHSLSLLLCVRTVLPKPLGPDSDVVFIDGGNLFDAYSISEHSIALGLDSEKVHERIHLSRAFTYHQLDSLVTERLPFAMDKFNARLAVISDITQLYCDPDVQDKKEARDIFAKSVRSLGALAELKRALIVATNLQSRNRSMDKVLMHTAHVLAKLEDRGAFAQLTVARHPFIPQHEAEVSTLDNQTLGRYL